MAKSKFENTTRDEESIARRQICERPLAYAVPLLLLLDAGCKKTEPAAPAPQPAAVPAAAPASTAPLGPVPTVLSGTNDRNVRLSQDQSNPRSAVNRRIRLLRSFPSRPAKRGIHILTSQINAVQTGANFAFANQMVLVRILPNRSITFRAAEDKKTE
jgi:hypothetical protein